jgi:hypothetical protein
MNTFTISCIVSAAIAFFAVLTKPKVQEGTDPENHISTFIRTAIISFVCIYFGMTYLVTPACPEINMGEPDF